MWRATSGRSAVLPSQSARLSNASGGTHFWPADANRALSSPASAKSRFQSGSRTGTPLSTCGGTARRKRSRPCVSILTVSIPDFSYGGSDKVTFGDASVKPSFSSHDGLCRYQKATWEGQGCSHLRFHSLREEARSVEGAMEFT